MVCKSNVSFVNSSYKHEYISTWFVVKKYFNLIEENKDENVGY